MILRSANKLIALGVVLPLVAYLAWAFYSATLGHTRPLGDAFVGVGVALVTLGISLVLVTVGTIVGSINFVRARAALQTRDFIFLAVGVNALLSMLAMFFVITARA